LEHHNKLVADSFFREALESQKKDNAPLFHLVHLVHLIHLIHLVHSDDLKYVDIFRRFSIFAFKDLLFEFLSLIVKVRLLE
jgi:hypothetical protein